jgi:hypothetical protein
MFFFIKKQTKQNKFFFKILIFLKKMKNKNFIIYIFIHIYTNIFYFFNLKKFLIFNIK